MSSALSCAYCSFNIKLFAVVFHEENYLIGASYNLCNPEITTSVLNRFKNKLLVQNWKYYGNTCPPHCNRFPWKYPKKFIVIR